MFTSDRASVMLGRHNGVAAQLKKEIPHLTQQHCVAHREDLGITDTWKRIKLLCEIETLMRTVYTMFSRSSNKKQKLKEVAAALEHEAIAFRPLNDVRWFSRHFALNAIVRNYDSLIQYFNEELQTSNDPIASYCYKKFSDPQIYITLEVVNDVSAELASLCKALQKSGLTPIDAMDMTHAKIQKIKCLYLGEVPNWSEKVKSTVLEYAAKGISIDSKPILTFIENVCYHLEDRFPENEIQDWIAFDVSKLKLDFDFKFGNEEISSLCKKYSIFLTAPEQAIKEQYNNFKFYAQRKLKTKSVNSFLELVQLAYKSEEYSDLTKLLDIGGTFMASSADCERGFSLMNSIKTKQRNRMGDVHLDMIVRIKSYIESKGAVNLDYVYRAWVQSKDRRKNN